MKTYLLYFIILGMIFMLFSCESEDYQVEKMAFSSSVIIPDTSEVQTPLKFQTSSVSTSGMGYSYYQKLRKVNLDKMLISLDFGEMDLFNTLEYVHIYQKTRGKRQVKIAWLDSLDQGMTTSVELNTTSRELEEYYKNDHFYWILRTKLKDSANRNYKLTIRQEITYHIEEYDSEREQDIIFD